MFTKPAGSAGRRIRARCDGDPQPPPALRPAPGNGQDQRPDREGDLRPVVNDETKFADWVAYRLDLATVDGPSQDERNYLPDSYLDPDETLEPEDYDSAFLSNIVPQESGLNRGGWQTAP